MKEFQLKFHGETSPMANIQEQKTALQRKFSVDLEQCFVPQSPNFYSFSRIADQHFLNSCNSFRSFDLPPNEILSIADWGTSSDFCSNSIENANNCSNPSTPTSFGFKECAYRIARVTLKHKDFQKTFSNTHLYLVGDMYDSNMAGLLFKHEGMQIDLRIEKNLGKQLQRIGEVKNMQCQLWVDENTQWIQVSATIVLLFL